MGRSCSAPGVGSTQLVIRLFGTKFPVPLLPMAAPHKDSLFVHQACLFKTFP